MDIVVVVAKWMSHLEIDLCQDLGNQIQFLTIGKTTDGGYNVLKNK